MHSIAARTLPAAFLALGAGIELVLQMILQIFLLKEMPHVYNIIGASLVISGISFLAIRNYVIQRHEAGKKEKLAKSKELAIIEEETTHDNMCVRIMSY